MKKLCFLSLPRLNISQGKRYPPTTKCFERKIAQHLVVSGIIVLCFMLSACNIADPQPLAVEYENQDGSALEELSSKFSITVYPTKIITEENSKNIVYSLSVINASEEAFENFFVTIILNEELDQYIAAGVYPLPFTKINMAAKSNPNPAEGESKGVEIVFQQLLSNDQFMKEARLDYKDVLELGQEFDLWLQWDGGEEKYHLSSFVVDESA